MGWNGMAQDGTGTVWNGSGRDRQGRNGTENDGTGQIRLEREIEGWKGTDMNGTRREERSSTIRDGTRQRGTGQKGKEQDR